MNQAIEIYNQLMIDKPELACKVTVKDIKRVMRLNKPRLKEWINNQKAKKRWSYNPPTNRL